MATISIRCAIQNQEALRNDLMTQNYTSICNTWLVLCISYTEIALEQIHANFCYQNFNEKDFSI